MKHPERIKYLLLIALGIFFASVILFQIVYAKNDTKTIVKNTGLFSKYEVIVQAQSLVSARTDQLAIQQEETKKITDTKQSLEQNVTSLKEYVTNLEDMFVKIDKYAPDSSGNTYVPGNCTWGVKSWRPDISNSWGNANTWFARAQAQGWNVGTKPKKGAVATSTSGWLGHVAYVEGVSLDGQWVKIKEMNYGHLYNMNTRTVHYTEFKYIYELN